MGKETLMATPDVPLAAPYREAWYVERGYDTTIREAIKEALIQAQKTPRKALPIFHLWGLKGAGKSWALQHIESAYRYQAASDRRSFAARADCGVRAYVVEGKPLAQALLPELVRKITDQLPAEARARIACEAATYTELQTTLARLEDGGRDSPEQAAAAFVAWVSCLSETYPGILLFDTAEELTQLDRFWLESALIAPLARTDRVVMVIAGRREIPRWREMDVRRRLTVIEVEPFDEGQTKEQMRLRGYADSAAYGEAIYRLSFGHPYAAQVFGEGLRAAWEHNGQAGEGFEQAHDAEVRDLMGRLEAEMLRIAGTEPRVKSLRALSVLRQFNVESARHMLAKQLDDSNARRSDGYFLGLFEELEDTTLVWWSTARHGYVIGEPLRQMLDLRVKKETPTRYLERHRQAQEMYEEWIARRPHNPAAFVVEALYHLTQRVSSDQRKEQIGLLLQRYLTSHHFEHVDQANELFKTLEDDADLNTYEEIMTPIAKFRSQF